MRLLLTSQGLSNQAIRDCFVAEMEKIKAKRACLIYTMRNPDDAKWLYHYEKEMDSVNIKYDWVNISQNRDYSGLTYYDVYYVCGGNTFYILDRLRKTKMDKVILDAIDRRKLYVGVSAGSIIVGPDIEIAGIGTHGDVNDIALANLAGFSLVPLHIYPHYENLDKKVVQDFYDRRHEPVVAITDRQAVLIDGTKKQWIGEKRGGLMLGYINIRKKSIFEMLFG